MFKSKCVYIPFIVLLIFGTWLFSNPYLIVPTREVSNVTLSRAPDNNIVHVILKIRSKGTFTEDYPIDVEVELAGEGLDNMFHMQSDPRIGFPDAYTYPIVKGGPSGSAEGWFAAGGFRISMESLKGSGTIIFPFSGTYPDPSNDRPAFSVWQDDVELTRRSTGRPIFKIEGYSVRLQIENSNRILGLGIVALSVTTMGLIFSLTRRKSQREHTQQSNPT